MSEKVKIKMESDEFLKKFKNAATEIEDNVADVSGGIKQALVKLEDILPQIENLEELNHIPDEILGTVEKIHSEVEHISTTVNFNEERIINLLNHFNIEDPKITYIKNMFKSSLNRYIESGEDITTEKFLNDMEKIYFGASKEQLILWRDEVLKENGV
jgi:DNA repair ATPase RecN